MGVYKEGKNWKVQVYYKDWQGNQKRKQKRGFRTKGEAKEWERDFLQQQSQGVDIEFGNFLEIYYKDMDVRLREHTMYTKRYIIDLKIRPYFEKKILSEITVADVRAWQNELLMYKDKNGKCRFDRRTKFMRKYFLELFAIGLVDSEGRINTEHMTSDALMTSKKTMEELTKMKMDAGMASRCIERTETGCDRDIFGRTGRTESGSRSPGTDDQ